MVGRASSFDTQVHTLTTNAAPIGIFAVSLGIESACAWWLLVSTFSIFAVGAFHVDARVNTLAIWTTLPTVRTISRSTTFLLAIPSLTTLVSWTGEGGIVAGSVEVVNNALVLTCLTFSRKVYSISISLNTTEKRIWGSHVVQLRTLENRRPFVAHFGWNLFLIGTDIDVRYTSVSSANSSWRTFST